MLKIKEVYIHIIVWICFISFPLALSFSQFGEVHFDFLPRIVITPFLTYVNYLILVPVLLLKKRLWQYILVSVLLLIVFNMVVNTYFATGPLNRISEFTGVTNVMPLKRMSEAMLAIASFSFFLLGGVMGLTKDIYKREKRSRIKEMSRKETELQFLRAQLNPHFLFNSLNSIYSLVREKSSEAPQAVITLSELMRYMLYEAKKELVPLTKEIDYIKNFVQLQILRLSDSKNVKLRVSGEYEDKLIAPLLLVPFVENAFKYGTDFKGDTYVDINLKIVSETLFFRVTNKIGPYKKDLESSGIGLENIKNRLQILFPEEHSMLITKENGNYMVNLELQLA
ncbi:sensor histidine kinase [Flagellimonas meridianipacifica]|uniref:Histidine kinase n=1 Tax=Flagellimonas meridianipacifica TaxID=1080225 RepID=A0A2T0MD48_9FLAO|nr:histidine kinase [Allomuricauda pacifica]PRX55402.1 histidine kinase [Allomuricauda pacifica]